MNYIHNTYTGIAAAIQLLNAAQLPPEALITIEADRNTKSIYLSYDTTIKIRLKSTVKTIAAFMEGQQINYQETVEVVALKLSRTRRREKLTNLGI